MRATMMQQMTLPLKEEEEEVRTDVQKGRQLAAGTTGVVARPELVARADDRRLLAGAASLAQIFSPSVLSMLSIRTSSPLLNAIVDDCLLENRATGEAHDE
jgi:hypothetical protein